jgi:hypothetical protein
MAHQQHGHMWPCTWLEEDDVKKSHPDLLQWFKYEICRGLSSLPPDTVVNSYGERLSEFMASIYFRCSRPMV